MGKPFRRILLIKMRFHGDMLLATSVISSLKKNYPDAKIDALLYQDVIPIPSENPGINALYDIRNKKTEAPEKITSLFHFVKILHANKYDLIVNPTDQWMVAILTHLLNACVKIPQNYHHRQPTSWRKSSTRLALLQGGNVVENNLSVLTPLGLDSLVKQTTMSYPPASWKRMRRELDHAGIGQSYMVIQPMAR